MGVSFFEAGFPVVLRTAGDVFFQKCLGVLSFSR